MSRELGPAAVLRAAAWPLEALQGFGAPELFEHSSSPGFLEAYGAALERERRFLWESTVLSDRFLRALLFASPSLFARVRRAEGPTAVRTKRVRHLETSLYRYLVRAATRTTPNGLWAGVTSADFSSPKVSRSRAEQLVFTPDLSVFARVFSVLAKQPIYLEACEFRLNPTVTPAGDTLQFLARTADGSVEIRAIAATPALVTRLAPLREHAPATLTALARASALPRDVLVQLLELGFFVGGLRLPPCFSSPWQALEAAEAALLGEHRVALKAALTRLREQCGELGATFAHTPLTTLEAQLHASSQTLRDFLSAIGNPSFSFERALHCDLRLPCELALGPERAAALASLLGDYEREWLHGASPFARSRAARRRALSDALARAPLPLGRALPTLERRDEPWAASEAWSASFDANQSQILLASSSPSDAGHHDAPWGCLLVRLAHDGVGAVLGVDDSPTRPFARFTNSLDHGEPLRRWLAAVFQRFEREHACSVRELVLPFEQNPNVLGRPELGLSPLDPWGVSGPSLSRATLSAAGNGLVIAIPGAPPSLALTLSVARVLERDPLAEQLALTGFDESALPGFRAAGLLHPDELREPRHAPRLALSSGVRLRARRTCLSGSAREPLGSARRESAYPLWVELAKRFDWGSHLTVTLEGAQPLWLAKSSPLGLEAVLEGSAPASHLLVEEFTETGFLHLAGGRHLTDLAVPFVREEHAFSALHTAAAGRSPLPPEFG